MTTNQYSVAGKYYNLWDDLEGQVRVQTCHPVRLDELQERIVSNTLHQPFIIETDHERRLHFNLKSSQSRMLIASPNVLVDSYTRKMMAFLLFIPAPIRILMIGLGGGSLAKFCYHELSKADITVVEINPDVIAFRSEFMIPKDNHRFRVIQQDGAEFMAHCNKQFDVILVDAFDPDGIALSLPSLSFYDHAFQCLTRQGVLVMNMCGDDQRYPPNLNSLMTAFKARPILVTVQGSNNQLAFVSKHRVNPSMTAGMVKRAAQLKSVFKLQFPRYLRRLCQGQQR